MPVLVTGSHFPSLILIFYQIENNHLSHYFGLKKCSKAGDDLGIGRRRLTQLLPWPSGRILGRCRIRVIHGDTFHD